MRAVRLKKKNSSKRSKTWKIETAGYIQGGTLAKRFDYMQSEKNLLFV